MSMSLADANAIIAAAFRIGRERRFAALAVCILDRGGHMVSAQREDGCSNMRVQIAEGKANAALGIGRSTRFMQETMAVQRPGFVEALSVAAHGRFIPVAGGLLVRNAEGDLLGAIGVTGDTADNDELVAKEAVHAAGLKVDL